MIEFRQLELNLAAEADFEVRRFRVEETLHGLFEIQLSVVSASAAVDLDALLGADITFSVQRTPELRRRHWSGLVAECDHVGIDPGNDLSTYELTVVPRLWLLTQQRRYRVFQFKSDPEVVLAILAQWQIEPRCDFELGDYRARKYRVQYAEPDLRFVCRLLEDSGLSYFFEDHQGETRLVITDKPQAAPPREEPLLWVSAPIDGDIQEVVTAVEVHRDLKPGRYTQRDVDYRHPPEVPLLVTDGLDGLEGQLERYHQNYGAFLYVGAPPGDTPVADDRGAARIDMEMAQRQVQRRMAAQRTGAHRVCFSTSAHDVAPGQVVSFLDHPRRDLARPLLVLGGTLEGEAVGDWEHRVKATFADRPWHPPLATPKPKTFGVESATVVGSAGDDIHTDEFARTRVQFHWDREGARNETSSCWIPVNQPWGGAGFGALNIPRVGQEVIVDFLGQDPDRPVIVGRVFTKTNPVPYALPDHKTVSGIRSQTSNQPGGFLQQLAQKVIAAGKDKAQEAIVQALSEAAEQTFGDRMPPLAQLIPQAAGMLAKLSQPGGVSFPSPGDENAPAPPLTNSDPSRAAQAFSRSFPDGVRMAAEVLSGAMASAFIVDATARPFWSELDPMASLLGAPPEPLAVMSVPPMLPTPASPALPRIEDELAVPIEPLIPEVLERLPDVPLPEVPMNLERIQAAMDNGFGAASPSGATHLLAGSEVTLDDTLGSERLYVQAQRDHNIVTGSNANTIVTGNRSTKVGTSDVVDVGRRQVERIGQGRIVDVYANQLHVVRNSIEQVSAEDSQQFSTAENHTTTAKVIAYMAEEHIAVDCGGPPPEEGAWNISGLLLMPEFIMLDAPKLYLNPGQAELDAAIATGEAPKTADEVRAETAAADAAAVDAELQRQQTEAEEILERAWQNRLLTHPSQQYSIFGTQPRLEEIDPEAYDLAWDAFRSSHPLEMRGGIPTGRFVPPPS